MNQQTLLETIHRHLSDSRRETEPVRTLSEIVSLVANDIRQQTPPGDVRSQIIPIGVVTAFVDGNVSDDEAQWVLNAIQVDNSVIAELVAAVKAKQEIQTETTGISDTLSSRLLKMGPPTVSAIGDIDTRSNADAARDTTSQPITSTLPDVQPITRSNPRSRSPLKWIVLAVAATAAAWLAFISIRPSNESSSPENRIVHSPGPDVERLPETNDLSIPETLPEERRREFQIVESPPPVDLAPTETPNPRPSLPAAMGNQRNTDDQVAATPASPTPSPIPAPTREVTPFDQLVWTRITGLAATQLEAPESLDYDRGERWSALEESITSMGDASERTSLNVVTLPLSRAEAKVQENGRLVLAPDTQIELRRDAGIAADRRDASCVIDVLHGSVALADILTGTVVDVRAASQPIAKLRWDTDGSVVIGFLPVGFAVEVHSGTVSIDDDAFEDSLLVLSTHDKHRVEGNAKRMPGWVNRPIDTIPVTNVVLAQLSTSKNMLTDIAGHTKRFASLPNRNANDARTLATLAMWQASLANQNLARLFSRTEPEVRNAAFARLIETPAWDARYDAIWAGVSRIMRSPRTTAQVKKMCENLRQRIGLNSNQIDLLLTGLAGPSLAHRAMCDYLLRSNYGGGPPFDPAWTGQSQVRAISLWRRAAGR